jgi:hypothetical protein
MKLFQEAGQFQKDTGLEGKEGVDFLTRWASDVSQYIGDPGNKSKAGLINEAQGKYVRDKIGKTVAGMGIPGKAGVKLGGAIIGATNWNQFGNKAGATAHAGFERFLQISSEGKGDVERNMELGARFINEMVQVDRSEGRIGGEGNTATDRAAVLLREVSEYNDQEAEVFARNAVEFARQTGKKSVAKTLKEAGINMSDNPVEDFVKLQKYFKKQKGGKVGEANETMIDFMRNKMKGNIRSAAGTYAIAMAEEKGLGQAAMEAVKGITPDTVAGLQAKWLEADPSMAMSQAREAAAAEARNKGLLQLHAETARTRAEELYTARGYGVLGDPRSSIEKGSLMNHFPFTMFQAGWDEKKEGPGFELYKELMLRNHPEQFQGYDKLTPDMQRATMNAATVGYWNSDEASRANKFNKEVGIYEAREGKDVIALLEELVRVAKEQAQGPKAVPMPAPQANMVKP